MEALDPKALRILTAVVRHGSIRGAARQLGLAPSILSRQIAETEHGMKVALFIRTCRGVEPTDAGRLVFEHAERVLEDGALLEQQIGQLRGVEQTRVRICSGEGFLEDLVERGLASFMSSHPNVGLSLGLGGTEEVLETVANGDADIGIAYNPEVDHRVRSIAVASQPLCLIAPIGHPALGKNTLAFAECLDVPYALLTRRHRVRHLVSRAAADHGMALHPVMETSSIDVVRRFVCAGLGATFLPRSAVAEEIARNAVGVAEIADPVLLQASTHLLVKARRRLPASVEGLAKCLSENMAAFNVQQPA